MSAPIRPIATVNPTQLTGQERKLYEAAKGLEAVFMRQIMSTMRSATQSLGGTPEDPARAMYQGMLDDKIATDWSGAQTHGLGMELFLSLRKALGPAAGTTP